MAIPPASPFRRRSRESSAGFTLVEVALAIGIVAFAFVALLALLPAGQNAFRQSIDVAVCSQIAQRIINEAQMSDFQALIDATNLRKDVNENFTFRAPSIRESALRYFDDQGREVQLQGTEPTPQERARIIYEVNTRIMPRAALPAQRSGIQMIPDSKIAPQPLAQVTVQVALNPTGVKLKFSDKDPSGSDPMRNLWIYDPTTAGIPIYTYAALVGRNE